MKAIDLLSGLCEMLHGTVDLVSVVMTLWVPRRYITLLVIGRYWSPVDDLSAHRMITDHLIGRHVIR